MTGLKQTLIALLPRGMRHHLRRWNSLRQVRDFQESDWEWSPIIRPLIKPGQTIVDAGANIGYLTRLFAQWVGPEGRVLAVEPVRETFEILRDAHEGEEWRHVFLLNAALSDTPGTATVVVPEGRTGVSNYYEAQVTEAAPPGAHAVQVEKRTLDEVCRHLELQPDFIKIDVEGHEMAVLRGAMETLVARRPALLIEVKGDPDQHQDPAARLFRLLMDFDYMPHVCRAGRLSLYRPGDRFVDVLFLTPAHGKALESVLNTKG